MTPKGSRGQFGYALKNLIVPTPRLLAAFAEKTAVDSLLSLAIMGTLKKQIKKRLTYISLPPAAPYIRNKSAGASCVGSRGLANGPFAILAAHLAAP
jgi:hypothetical protein